MSNPSPSALQHLMLGGNIGQDPSVEVPVAVIFGEGEHPEPLCETQTRQGRLLSRDFISKCSSLKSVPFKGTLATW